MSLVITKETDNLFSLVFDGGAPIRSEQNRLTTIGNLCNFKSGNGANLILKQNVPVTDVTLIASGTFTFTNVNDLFDKLFEVNFFGFNGGGGATIDRFDELDDTFTYFGRDGQVVVVNESQLRLETRAVDLFTAEDRAKLEGIETGAEVNVQADFNENNPESDAFIRNKPNLSALFSGIFEQKFTPNELDNTFTLPIGAQAMNLFIDRGLRYKGLEWTQTDNIVTVLGDQLPIDSDVYITGLTI